MDKQREVGRLYAECTRSFPDVPDIAPGELVRMRAAGEAVVVVDVREPAEQRVSMITGAVTRTAFEASKKDYGKHHVVTYCTAGYRAGRYATELKKQGYKVSNLEGSILGWLHAGGELVASNGVAKVVHVNGKRWDLAPAGYRTVWFDDSRPAGGEDRKEDE